MSVVDTVLLRLSEHLPGGMPDKVQVKALLSQCMAQLDLVTREEFDAQAAVLRRTCEKVDHLEQVVAQLEERLRASE